MTTHELHNVAFSTDKFVLKQLCAAARCWSHVAGGMVALAFDGARVTDGLFDGAETGATDGAITGDMDALRQSKSQLNPERMN